MFTVFYHASHVARRMLKGWSEGHVVVDSCCARVTIFSAWKSSQMSRGFRSSRNCMPSTVQILTVPSWAAIAESAFSIEAKLLHPSARSPHLLLVKYLLNKIVSSHTHLSMRVKADICRTRAPSSIISVHAVLGPCLSSLLSQ